MRRLLSLSCLLSLTPALWAQDATTKLDDAARAVAAGIGTEPIAGRKAGTLRYNVTFAERSFDLTDFRNAVSEREPAWIVAAIVQDLEDRARREQEGFRKAVIELGGDVVITFWLINACTIEIPPAALERVRAMANVLHVRPDLPTYPLGAAAPIRVATNSSHHNADAEQAVGNRATGYGIAIVDTSQDDSNHGTNLPHMLYYRNADRNNHSGSGMDGSRLLANVAVASQPANNSHPHGTGVASIAAGAGWNTAGADAGHASDANIVGYSICEFSGSCGSSLAIEAAGWQRVAADKVLHNIVAANMSYSSSPDPVDVSQQAIDACALNADVLPVCAAANNGSSTANSSSTANGIAVAAVTPVTKTVAGFSSRGPLSGDTQRFYPDLAACGVGTVMAQWGNESADWVADGTSMASPQVCGAAGLLKSAVPSLNAREMKAILLNSTESIATQNPGLSRNDYGMGFLRDDLACGAARSSGAFSAAITSTTTPVTHPLSVLANQRYSLTLVWHRHVLSARNWSDLNLAVKQGATVLASSNTPRNLYEKLEFTAPSSGNVTIEVSATSLEIASVPYSIAIAANDFASVEFVGTGCVAGSSSFYEMFGTGAFDLANRTIRLVPSGGGYLVQPGTHTYVAPTGVGLGLGDDQLAPPSTLPWTFSYPSGSTSQIIVCSNGFIYLNNTGSSAAYIPDVPSLLSGGSRLCGMWMDLLPDSSTNTNNVFYNVDTVNNRVLVTWRNVPEFGSSANRITLQMVLNRNGAIDILWQAATNLTHTALVGFSPGAGNRDNGSRDISATMPFQTQADSTPLTQDATRPVIGATVSLTVNNIPSGSLGGVEMFGAPLATPVDLTVLGMPTCLLHLTPIYLSVAFPTSSTTAVIPFAVPNNTSVLGAVLGVQAATVSPGRNALGVLASNLATLFVGRY